MLIGLAGIDLHAELTVKDYQQSISSPNETIVQMTKTYIEGLGEGLTWMNTIELSRHGTPAFCQPGKLALTTDNYRQMLDAQITAASAVAPKAQLDATPVPLLLLQGLKTTFPCPKGK